MPRRDGTGPEGMGSMTGRRMGLCNPLMESNGRDLRFAFSLGRRCRRGSGRYLYRRAVLDSEDREETLKDQKQFLQTQLKKVNDMLEDFKKEE